MKDENRDSFTHKLGDKLERIGEKISRKGSTKIGKKIYDAGNKLEHRDEVKKPR